ncbi:hypothetical protein F5Y14DRAFT_463973 [Nemania sp. NC0429]|nr:hypothetical protein F5Y14DRAFT_463973 [Nemania sp. NC0429]
MAQSSHSVAREDAPLGSHGVEHPAPNPIITSTDKRSHASHNIPTLTAPIVLKEQAQMSVSAEYFKEEKNQEVTSAESAGLFLHLQNAVASEEVDVLSRHKSTGSCLLEELAQILSAHPNCIDITQVESITRLKERAITPATILGVVGGTGHGKSSLINALLGEAKLVPTNCFRACTAVATEISWNPSDNPAHEYVAEIEFISADDWCRELEYLFHDLGISSGEISSENQIEESVAGVAWAKCKAVYPKLNKRDLGQLSAKLLASQLEVMTLLGTTKTVRKPTAEELYDGIRIYVDGKKTKKSKHLDPEEDHSALKRQLWPLIKVVRVYSKADVLSSGAVIVDLPGIRDSNAARAAVAGKYIEKCDGLWVVSMITRAVDDQAAQELLGTGFKRQLQLDGNFSNITFVCTKTDDINVDEAADSLDLSDEIKELHDARHNLSEFEASSGLDRLQKRYEAVSIHTEEVVRHIDRYEKLGNQQAKGNTVTPPKVYPTQRKLEEMPTRPNKRRKVSSNKESQDTQWVSTEDLWGDFEKGMPKFSADYHLTQVDIQLMVEYLSSRKQIAIEERYRLWKKIDEEEGCLKTLQQKVLDLEGLLYETCVSRRNNYSRQAIRDQFALGLKEFDQQEAQHIDPSTFDPEQELRDYAEAGRSLPVFCISARAYQSLAKDDDVLGFGDISDTEIPQLREHVKKLTEATRIKSCRSFLTDLTQELNSLYLWSSEPEVGLYLRKEEKQAEMEYVKEKVNELQKRLELASEELFNQLSSILEALFRCFEAAGQHAAKLAEEIAQSWPSYKRGDRGLPCATYQATVHLAAPFLQFLGSNWEDTFTKKVPAALDQHAKACKVHLEYIQSLIRSRMREKAASDSTIGVLQDQDRARSDGIINVISSLGSQITASQRQANRDFASAIQVHLKPKYKECSLDAGPGVFARIRLKMETEITEHRQAIFDTSYERAKERLSKAAENVREVLNAHTRVMRDRMLSDYTHVIRVADDSQEPKAVRQRLLEFLQQADTRFQ